MRKGISLVALVITIIVLIILTAAVFLNGGTVPEDAQKSVFYNDITTVQEAVSLKMVNNLSAMYTDPATAKTQLKGIVEGIVDADDALADGTVKGTLTVGGGTAITIYSFAADAARDLNIQGADLSKYGIDADGKVYYWEGKAIGTETYYTRDIFTTTATDVSGAVSVTKANL